MTKYINRKGDGYLETVDELEIKTKADRIELKRLLDEYRLSDRAGFYYVSSRSTKDWRKKR
ncbi:hypothetical protein EOM81_13310 [bacterium]|nr:hypothetical protein [bacterium]